MTYKKWIFWLTFVLFALVLFIIADPLLLFRPLFLTTQWEVKAATHDGRHVSVKIYKELTKDEVFLLYVKGGRNAPLNPQYPGIKYHPQLRRWFVVDFSDNKKERYLIHPDDNIHIFSTPPRLFPALGPKDLSKVEILSPKIEEAWYLSDMGDTIVFSNQVFFVSMTKKNSVRPPVEAHRRTGNGERKEW